MQGGYVESMIAVVFAVGLLAAVMATCLAGGFIQYGWEFYRRVKLQAMHACGVAVGVTGLVFIAAVHAALPGGESLWVAVFAVAFDVIVGHEIWQARRKLGLTRSIRNRINRRQLSGQQP